METPNVPSPAQPRPESAYVTGLEPHRGSKDPQTWAASRPAPPFRPVTGLEQTPIQRLLEHQRKDEHHWVWNMLRRVIACTECGIARFDWEHMRQARARLDKNSQNLQVDPVPVDAMTTLERQLTAELEIAASAIAAMVDELQHSRAVVEAARALVESAANSYTLVVDTVTGNTQSDVLTNLRQCLAAMDEHSSP